MKSIKPDIDWSVVILIYLKTIAHYSVDSRRIETKKPPWPTVLFSWRKISTILTDEYAHARKWTNKFDVNAQVYFAAHTRHTVFFHILCPTAKRTQQNKRQGLTHTSRRRHVRIQLSGNSMWWKGIAPTQYAFDPQQPMPIISTM